MYIFARFEPKPACEHQQLDELTSVLEPTRAEPGCVRVNLYESMRGPWAFLIHSEWIDEAAFDIHAELPHILCMLRGVEGLIAQPLHVWRTKQIG